MSQNFKYIQVVETDTEAGKFKNWPPQLENISLTEIHRDFLKDCDGKYRQLISSLRNRTVWMINSTAVGGGVAEMLPMLISMFSDVNVTIKWVVISPPASSNQEAFFNLTKQIHNNIHGVFNEATMERLGPKQADILETVCSANAEEFMTLVNPDDVIVIHDPQPLAMIKFIKQRLRNIVVWRCHIGVDFDNDTTNATWQFLKPYIDLADHVIFSLKSYFPKYVINGGQPYSVIPPAISPFTMKNIELDANQMMGVLSRSGIVYDDGCSDLWKYRAQKVCGNSGRLVPCSSANDMNLDLLFSPVVCEISRWDALKGWSQLIEAFVYLKQNADSFENAEYIKRMVLVLGGPDPKFIQDDPEGVKVFADLCGFYQKLGQTNKDIQNQIYIISVPMDNTEQNALIINALQRLSAMVVQNSLMEGFGLTVTEAMYKGTPMIASEVGGIKTQLFDRENGVSISDPRDFKVVAKAIAKMAEGGLPQMKKYAIEGKKNVIKKFLIWSQCRNYLDMLKVHVPNRSRL